MPGHKPDTTLGCRTGPTPTGDLPAVSRQILHRAGNCRGHLRPWLIVVQTDRWTRFPVLADHFKGHPGNLLNLDMMDVQLVLEKADKTDLA